jgi:hypothetical protein
MFIKDLYYDITIGISNIIAYIPIIWRDRDFDENYFHLLMRFKLIRMEKAIRNGHTLDADKDADNIQHAIDLLNKITGVNEYDYSEEALKPFYAKYPDCDHISWYKTGTFADIEEKKKLHSECDKKEEEMEKADLDELYSFLRKHVNEFWE